MKRLRPFLLSWEALLVLLLVVAIVLGSVLSPYFLSSFNFYAITSNVMEVAIMALPMTLIVIAGEIDLSVEGVMGLASIVLGYLWLTGHPLWLGICAALLLGLVAGGLNGILITRLGLPSLVVTIGTLSLFTGLSYVILQGQAVSSFPQDFVNFGTGTIASTEIPWSALIFAILVLLFVVLLHFSRLGRQIYAMGENKEAARFAGIYVRRIKQLLFLISGLLASLAGIIFTARLASATPGATTGLSLHVVTVVLLGGVNIFGGRGSMLGVVLAIFILAVLQNILGLLNISGDIQSFAIGLLLIFSVLGSNLARRIQIVFARQRSAAGSSQGH